MTCKYILLIQSFKAMQPHNINFNVLPRGDLVLVSVIIYSLNQFENVNLKKRNQFVTFLYLERKYQRNQSVFMLKHFL